MCDSVGMTLPFDVSGLASHRKQMKKNKTWFWTQLLKQRRKKSPRPLLKLSPSWQHDPLKASDTLFFILVNDVITDLCPLRHGQKANMFSCISYRKQQEKGKSRIWTQVKSPAVFNSVMLAVLVSDISSVCTWSACCEYVSLLALSCSAWDARLVHVQ